MEHNSEHTMDAINQMRPFVNKNSTPTRNDHKSNIRLAISATVHCLVGCGLGEVIGMIISAALNMNMIDATVLSVVLGFFAGLLLGIVPLLRAGFNFKRTFKIVIVAEGLSIFVMETFEVLTQWMIPGVMEAGLGDEVFWFGMITSLAVGFLAALPTNYFMIKRGVRHHH